MIAVMGLVHLAPGEIERLAGDLAAMIAATRAEEGCISYVYARDMLDPDRLVVSELWRDEAALTAHFQSPHMAELNRVIAAAKIHALSIKRYDVGAVATLMGDDR